jgi:hypothetical protein
LSQPVVVERDAFVAVGAAALVVAVTAAETFVLMTNAGVVGVAAV